MNKNIILALAVFFSLFLCEGGYAQVEAAGTVIAVQGQAYAKSQTGDKRVLHRRDSIYLHEVITTENNSKATLLLKDETILTLLPGTVYSVEAMQFDKNNFKDSRYAGNFVKGALLTISGASNPENHKLKTPLTTISIRGTMYYTKTTIVSKTNTKTTRAPTSAKEMGVETIAIKDTVTSLNNASKQATKVTPGNAVTTTSTRDISASVPAAEMTQINKELVSPALKTIEVYAATIIGTPGKSAQVTQAAAGTVATGASDSKFSAAINAH